MKNANRWMQGCGAAFVAAAMLSVAGAASATETVRFGKAVGSALSFTVVDVGIAEGIFAKHGLEVTITDFGGDAKLQQGLISESLDLGIGSGPAMAFAVKGAPVVAVAVLIDPPGNLGVVVGPKSPIRQPADLKDKLLSISTTGSLTEWLVKKLSAAEGWGPNGIRTVAVGAPVQQMAALRTGQVDGIMGAIQTGDELAERGEGRVLLSMDRYVPHFVSNVIFARKALVADNPKLVDRFLKGFYQSMAFFLSHKKETLAVAAKVVHASPAVLSKTYDAQLKLMVPDGHFDPQGLAFLKDSFVDLHILPAEPTDEQMLTRRFLPVKF